MNQNSAIARILNLFSRMRRILRAAPKYTIAFGLICISSALFLVWWLRRGPKTPAYRSPVLVQPEAPENAPKSRRDLKGLNDRIILVDNDAYDAVTGELLAKDWLEGGIPQRIFWHADSNSLVGLSPQMVTRYGLDGALKVKIVEKQFELLDEGRLAIFVKEKDIWKAPVDWHAFSLGEKSQVTKMGQILEANFAANTILGTAKTLVVRNLGQVLRVKLETGEVRPTRLPLRDIEKRRSPDNRFVVGAERGQFYRYDVDADETKTTPIGKEEIVDFHWLGNKCCAVIASARAVVIFDSTKNAFEPAVSLPFPCLRLGQPSPSQRFIFCVGTGNKIALVDLGGKSATAVSAGLGITWLGDDTFAFSREVPDTIYLN